MVDCKIETLASIVNLFLLFLMVTLGGPLYNSANSNGVYALGWIAVSQVVIFYLLLIYIKLRLIPSIERQLESSFYEGFKLYSSIHYNKKQIRNLEVNELELL
jgi:hypothetical protein